MTVKLNIDFDDIQVLSCALLKHKADFLEIIEEEKDFSDKNSLVLHQNMVSRIDNLLQNLRGLDSDDN